MPWETRCASTRVALCAPAQKPSAESTAPNADLFFLRGAGGGGEGDGGGGGPGGAGGDGGEGGDEGGMSRVQQPEQSQPKAM